MKSSPTSIRSVDKALDIVELLGASDGLGLAELARALDLNRSTAHHLLATLRGRGFVDQDERTRTYRLGYRVVGLVNLFLRRNDLVAAATGPIRALRDASGESAQFKVLQGTGQASLIDLPGSRPVHVRAPFSIGEPDLYCTASGKVLLAYLPRDNGERLTAALPFTRFTASTLADPDALRAELAIVRAQGYAVDREERFEGVMCVAAPVFGRAGAVPSLGSRAGRRAAAPDPRHRGGDLAEPRPRRSRRGRRPRRPDGAAGLSSPGGRTGRQVVPVTWSLVSSLAGGRPSA
jgi:DNA-binding IclR family transcriptional regulator